MNAPPSPAWLTPLAICLGASVGALLRWRLSAWLNTGSLLPWGTLAANWLGAYAVGLALVFFQQHSSLEPAWRMAVVTGLLGALTTFSTFSLETVAMLQSGRLVLGLTNAALHVVGSLLLTGGGMVSGQLLWPLRP